MNPNDKIQRLKELMGNDAIQDLNSLVTKALDEDPDINQKNLYRKYLFPKIRQFGFKVQVKKRKLPVIQFVRNGQRKVYAFTYPLKSTLLKSIEKKVQEKKEDFTIEGHMSEIVKYLYSKNALIDLDHYSLWINNQVYHWGPGLNWTIFGSHETDREITNEWELDPESETVYFTLRTKEEIEKFCSKFQEKSFDAETYNSLTFKDELSKFLGLDF